MRKAPRRRTSESSSLEKTLQAKLEASELKVHELQAELLGYKTRIEELETEIAREQEVSKKLQARVRDYGMQLLPLMKAILRVCG